MKYSLSHRIRFRRAMIISLCSIMLAVVVVTVVHYIRNTVNAATENGGSVQLQYAEIGVSYGGTSTHFFKINGKDGYCAIPEVEAPDPGTYVATALASNTLKRQQMVLAAYIYEHRNDDTNARYYINAWYPGKSDEEMYGWTHSVIAYLYDNGNTGTLDTGSADFVRRVAGNIKDIIDHSEVIWTQRASKYQLYELSNIPSGKQNIVWIEKKDEPTPEYGSIRVTKKDATTNSDTPQGNASFNGIKFTAKKGQIEKSCTLNNSNSCTISNLEYGDYIVSESAGNNTYQVNVNTTRTVTVNGGTEDVEFKNEVKKGSIKVRKKDSKMQDGVCKTTSGHSFNGITFGLYLDESTNYAISYGGQTHQPNGGLIARKTIGQEGCEVTFDNLPIAKYYIKEISANNDYILSDEIKYAEITAANNSAAIEVEFSNAPTSLGTVATDKNDGDHYVEAQSNATIVDKVNYCVEPGRQYVIKGVLMDKSTGKELLIGGKKIESSAEVKPTASCGSATMEFVIDARELGGKDVVVFERLYEYKDNGNYENEDPIVKHENINDSKQTVTIISLGTEAKDGIDDDKQILADKTAVVKDTISYCLKPGQKYTIRGTLIDKATGEPLLVDGNKIEGAMEIEPTEACGTAEMLFHFDATGMGGKEVVAFERLYIFKAETNDEGDPIIVHEDPNDEAQTVFIYLPPPNTGRFASKEGDGQISGSILAPVAIITLVGGYGIYRATAKKRFLRKR